MNSKELWSKRAGLVDAMNAAVLKDEMDEARRYEGRIAAIDEMLTDAIEDEDAERVRAVVVSGSKTTFTEAVLGPKASFKELQPGWKAIAPVEDTLGEFATPVSTDKNLPFAVEAPRNFLDTLPKGIAEGAEMFYVLDSWENNAAAWAYGGDPKPESNLAVQAVAANPETIAHWIPIPKLVARRYTQLDDMVRSFLLEGLREKADQLVLTGSNASGITGVVETAGITAYTWDATKNLLDNIRDMAAAVRIACGMAPNYVAMPTATLNSLAQLQDGAGHYIYPSLSAGQVLPGTGMVIVEDNNLLWDDDSDTVAEEHILVYNSRGARFKILDRPEVTIGLVNAQFINNAYTMLGEMTALLRVDIPSAFCVSAIETA